MFFTKFLTHTSKLAKLGSATLKKLNKNEEVSGAAAVITIATGAIAVGTLHYEYLFPDSTPVVDNQLNIEDFQNLVDVKLSSHLQEVDHLLNSKINNHILRLETIEQARQETFTRELQKFQNTLSEKDEKIARLKFERNTSYVLAISLAVLWFLTNKGANAQILV